jgi:hypothetical protein
MHLAAQACPRCLADNPPTITRPGDDVTLVHELLANLHTNAVRHVRLSILCAVFGYGIV